MTGEGKVKQEICNRFLFSSPQPLIITGIQALTAHDNRFYFDTTLWKQTITPHMTIDDILNSEKKCARANVQYTLARPIWKTIAVQNVSEQ